MRAEIALSTEQPEPSDLDSCVWSSPSLRLDSLTLCGRVSLSKVLKWILCSLFCSDPLSGQLKVDHALLLEVQILSVLLSNRCFFNRLDTALAAEDHPSSDFVIMVQYTTEVMCILKVSSDRECQGV